MRIDIIRCQQNESATIGMMLIDGTARFLTLEKPWKENQEGESCIPAGIYRLRKRKSPRFKRDLYEVLAVPGRMNILIHAGNTKEDTEGCILLGAGIGVNYITESKEALNSFMLLLEGKEDIELRIV